MTNKVDELIETLSIWLPSETDDFAELVFSILASLPGGEKLADLVAGPFETYQECDQLAVWGFG